MASATILVVEDEGYRDNHIIKTLKILGYNVIFFVFWVRKSIEKYEKIKPDLILIDIRLNGSIDRLEDV